MSRTVIVSLGLIISLGLLNYLVWQSVVQADPTSLKINFLNIGQGDAILIQLPTGEDILIDGGPDNTVLTALGQILPIWDRELDLVVATHLDADHITGLISVLQNYRVAEILTPSFYGDTVVAKTWENVIANAQKINYADSTDDYTWGEVTWDTLWPLPDADFSNNSDNANSTVANLIYGQHTILLTADIDADVENDLVALYPGLRAEILKVGHHGSKYSSTQAFLQSIHPDVAVISVGKNSYGHPAPETLQRLMEVGAQIYRTDQDGTIKVILSGQQLQITTDG
ncbi:MAG: MBL fold metallo-hydrolase [Patescibacteria group bacterium]